MGENGDSPNGFFRFPRGVWTPIDSRMAAYYSQRRRLQSGVKQFEFWRNKDYDTLLPTQKDKLDAMAHVFYRLN
jgi:hypothetical protein